MEIDFVAERSLKRSFLVAFFLSLFNVNLAFKIILFGGTIFFFVLFFLASSWATSHPEKKIFIGFWVSFWHTFFIFLGGFLGIGASFLIPTSFLASLFSSFKSWFFQSLPKF